MYYVSKRLEISGAHAVNSCVEGYCEDLHGHNWIITVHCKSRELNEDGMVVDFTRIKKQIHGVIDHTNLNETLPMNPTAENIARWCAEHEVADPADFPRFSDRGYSLDEGRSTPDQLVFVRMA